MRCWLRCRTLSSRCAALAAVVFLAATLTRLRARPGPAVLAGAVALVALIDLALAQRGLNPTAPRAALSARPPVVAIARPAPHQRLFVFDYTRAGTAPRFLSQEQPFVTELREEDWLPWHGQLAMRTTRTRPSSPSGVSRDPTGPMWSSSSRPTS